MPYVAGFLTIVCVLCVFFVSAQLAAGMRGRSFSLKGFWLFLIAAVAVLIQYAYDPYEPLPGHEITPFSWGCDRNCPIKVFQWRSPTRVDYERSINKFVVR